MRLFESFHSQVKVLFWKKLLEKILFLVVQANLQIPKNEILNRTTKII